MGRKFLHRSTLCGGSRGKRVSSDRRPRRRTVRANRRHPDTDFSWENGEFPAPKHYPLCATAAATQRLSVIPVGPHPVKRFRTRGLIGGDQRGRRPGGRISDQPSKDLGELHEW